MTSILAPPEVEWRRLSGRMLLVHPVTEVGKALPAIAGAFLAGHSSRDGNGWRWSAGITVVVVAFAMLRWFTTRYRITPDQIQLRHGLLRRKSMTAPMDRVRTVDVTSHLLHRVLGLARVVIGTGTSDRKGHDRLVLDGLTASAATALRAELLHQRGGVATEVPVDATAPAAPLEEELARIDPGWLRFAPFTLTGAVTGLAVLGIAWRVISEGRVDLRTIAPYRVVARQLEKWPVGLDIAGVLAGVIVFVALASTAGYVLSFWRFRLTRHAGGTLHVSRGLITSRATSIEHRRLRGVELSEPLLLRSVGGARCLAIATGLRVGRGSERGGEILLPPAPRAEALRVDLAAHPIAARRRRIGRALFAALVLFGILGLVAAVTGAPGWVLYFGVLPIVASVPLGADRFRSLGHAVVGRYLVTSFGSIVRRRCAVDVDGVIGWNLRTSWFQRRVGLASLVATTAAGRQKYVIADIAGAEAIRFAAGAVPGLLDDFIVG
jgi:putative membrane protein